MTRDRMPGNNKILIMSYYGHNSSYFQYSCKYIQCTLVTYVMSCIYTLYLHCAFVVTDNHMTKALIRHSVLNSLIRNGTPNKQHGSHPTLSYAVLSHI